MQRTCTIAACVATLIVAGTAWSQPQVPAAPQPIDGPIPGEAAVVSETPHAAPMAVTGPVEIVYDGAATCDNVGRGGRIKRHNPCGRGSGDCRRRLRAWISYKKAHVPWNCKCCVPAPCFLPPEWRLFNRYLRYGPVAGQAAKPLPHAPGDGIGASTGNDAPVIPPPVDTGL